MKYLYIIIIIILIIVWIINNKEKKLEHYEYEILKKKRIKIISNDDRDLELIKYHQKSFHEYSKKYNYEYKFYNKFDSKLPPYWKKMEIILKELENKNYEYILYVDSDTIINIEIPIEYLIDKNENKFIYIGYDVNYMFKIYNAGIILIKNNEMTRNFFLDCINYYKENKYCKENGKNILKGEWAGECYEQGVMNYYLKLPKYKYYMKQISSKYFHNHNKFNSNTFICHFFSSKGKKDISNKFKEIIKNKRRFINVLEINNDIDKNDLIILKKSQDKKIIKYDQKPINEKIEKIIKFFPIDYKNYIFKCYNKNEIIISKSIYKNETIFKYLINNDKIYYYL